MRGMKERARSMSALSSDIDDSEADQGEGEQGDTASSRKKARTSRSSGSAALVDMLREDARKNEDIMKLFIAGMEQDRLDQKERREREREKEEQEGARQREMQEKEY